MVSKERLVEGMEVIMIRFGKERRIGRVSNPHPKANYEGFEYLSNDNAKRVYWPYNKAKFQGNKVVVYY